MNQKVLTWAYYILFFATPLFFTRYNHELFEYNKMMLVYGLSVVVLTGWLWKMLDLRKFILSSTPLDIPILLFFLSQLLSTIFSIDPHTSIWGYYTRSNGGLLSIVAYIILFYGLVSNFNAEQVIKFIKAAIFGGLVVSLYAIPEHFGVSPSCIILSGQATASCWIQDVQARVFATLGQPNWLAAYLGMLIFPAIYFAITSKKQQEKILYFYIVTAFYIAFTFTYSRGGMIGFLAGLAIFSAFQLRVVKLKSLLPVLGIFLAINLLFGSALTSFKLIQQAAPPPRPSIVGSGGGTQLENGGTESGQIRLIVWKGAIDIFKHYPILGSGVETFAYSYYQFRPLAHNMVSEWDFLYNKAHNEYLNYLATTGIVGFGSYLILILSFIYWSIKRVIKKDLFALSILAGYVSYLVQNVFGFSVVVIAMFFFLFPAMAFVVANDVKESKLPAGNLLFRRKLYEQSARALIIIFGVYFLVVLINYWRADAFYKKGADYEEDGEIAKSYNYLVQAVNLNKGEPLYRADLGFISAAAAVGKAQSDATLSAELKQDSIDQTRIALRISPANISLWRTAIRTFFQLSSIDGSFEQKTIDAFDQAIKMAPTDPKLYYNKGLVLNQLGRNEEAVEALKKALEIKPNYREANSTLEGLEGLKTAK